jgi:sodium-dependent dicarboxylate transporter 2/3/5
MGGFFLAKAIEKWNLHARMALHIISLIGVKPRQIILGLMVATAFLSMWISDTAATMVMFPIAMAILHHVSASKKEVDLTLGEAAEQQRFASCLLLSIAYASLIGGIATLIGTPPNIVFAATMKSLYPGAPEITFFQWIRVGLPLTMVFLPLTWFYLTRLAIPVTLAEIPEDREMIRAKTRSLGPMKKGERYTLLVFLLAVFGWVFRNNISIGVLVIPGWSNLLGVEENVKDSTVAIAVALLLFIIPENLKEKRFLLDWDSAMKIPWGVLLLFGGGIALASAVKSSGLSQWIAESLGVLSNFPAILMVLAVCLLMTFLTEITSNTAVSTVFMPTLGAIAVAMDSNPMLLMIPAAMSASCAFMLPVATPPNAIVFGSGKVPASLMARTGLGLNLLGAVLITTAIYFLAIPLFEISTSGIPEWARQ